MVGRGNNTAADAGTEDYWDSVVVGAAGTTGASAVAWFAVGLGVTLAGLATLLTVYRIRRQVSAALAPAVA